jgi:phage major head subunit gpT-like protein
MQVYRDIRLSTSTLSSPALGTGGFGPVSRTRCPLVFATLSRACVARMVGVVYSYGVGYGTEDNGCGFHVMSYGLDAAGMCDNLGKAMAEMREVMLDGRN